MEVKEIAKRVIKYPLLTEARKRIEELEGEVSAQLKKIDELNSKLSSLSSNNLPREANSELDYYIARAVLPSFMRHSSTLQTSVPFKNGYVNISVFDDKTRYSYSSKNLFKVENYEFESICIAYPRSLHSAAGGLNKYRTDDADIKRLIDYIGRATGNRIVLSTQLKGHPSFLIEGKPHLAFSISGNTDNCGATFVRGMKFCEHTAINNDPDVTLFAYMYRTLLEGKVMCFYSDYKSGETSMVSESMLKRVFDELSKTKRFEYIESDRGVAFGSLIHSTTKDTILNPNSSNQILSGFFGLSSEHADGEDY